MNILLFVNGALLIVNILFTATMYGALIRQNEDQIKLIKMMSDVLKQCTNVLEHDRNITKLAENVIKAGLKVVNTLKDKEDDLR